MQHHISYPDKVSIDGLEERWKAKWESDGTYRFDETVPKSAVYSIDTPPPTVSGTLHIGHVFSYTHTDIIARFRRMLGFEVFYPMGFDDNGVPTERRVQNYYGVRCDPSLPYDDHFEVPETPHDPPLSVSRKNFIELCELLTQQDERVFEDLWRHLGLSVDWTRTYTTVGYHARRTSQRSFLDLLALGKIYASDAPTLWDVDFRTAVAQAELEDRKTKGTYFRVKFPHESGVALEIETSRPELIPACVAIVAHPGDKRYEHLIGTTAYSPLFSVPLPIVAHPLADPDKGTGIAMISTFGDLTDVTWWRELSLPTRVVMTRQGRLSEEVSFSSATWPSTSPSQAQAHYAHLVHKNSQQARKAIAELLSTEGYLLGEPKEIEHFVKYYEKGDRPLEIVASRQWYVRTLAEAERLIALGKDVQWHPPYMRTRYENWVSGLNSDWNVSRQRFFGIPIPIWYELDDAGEPRYDRVLVPEFDALPVDPQTDVPPHYREDQRGMPGGFTADPDIMDTWATSSLTPQLASRWVEGDPLYHKIFPMDLRPQAHDIIRTWLFYTMLRSELAEDVAPWSNASISGFVLDPDRKKMSKSKGNVVTPLPLLERHGADAVRYWAAYGRPGTDTAADEGQMKVGRRLAIKIANASKFVLSIAALESPEGPQSPFAIDQAMVVRVSSMISQATTALANYDYTKALDLIEVHFWDFCDNYLELVKVRAYGASEELSDGQLQGVASARAGLLACLSVFQRAFAPYLPYVCEETWSWWNEGSVHRNPWPTQDDISLSYLRYLHDDPALADPSDLSLDSSANAYELAREIIGEIRKAKAESKVSMKSPVKVLTVHGDHQTQRDLRDIWGDISAAGVVELQGVGSESPTLRVEVQLPTEG